jgi:eukaryotic-like serine/threonine-protein kinase
MLASGSRLGPYEIVAPLGTGGMGEVYRARDAKLNRDVAVKVLPSSFAGDFDRLAPFEREARMLAALNHPHIGAIYGLENAGGVPALVLELVEGETLAVRIARGPLALTECLTIARQLAATIEAAHSKGIVHRDLKPANIKITPDGVVKVLDFGLAKESILAPAPSDVTESGTATADGTGAGVILGTTAYMSPEQARGRPVDKRADIWAFGCVLYEMLTGSRVFSGETVSDTIAAILERAPDWSALPPDTPARVHQLLHAASRKTSSVVSATSGTRASSSRRRSVASQERWDPGRTPPRPVARCCVGIVLGNFDVVDDGIYYLDRVSGEAGVHLSPLL